MKTIVGCCALCLVMCHATFSQVDTTFIYNTGTPYGTLDIRIAKSATRYYYLQENKTFSFRESSPGVRTDTYRDMTSWDSSPYKQGNLREKNGSADYFIMNYRLLPPVNQTPVYSPGYPLIVMMHGAGERANCWDSNCFWNTRAWKPLTNNPAAPTVSNHELLNNDYNLLHGGNVHLQARNLAGSRLPDDPNLPGRAFPGFILFPQNLNGWDTNGAQDVIKLIRLLSKKYNIDPDRIYVHGLSNGGIATYDILKRAPWMFAAALPMSAPSESSIISKGLRPRIAHVPLWIFQGGKDLAPTPARTKGYIKSFVDGGAIVRYTEYSNLGHGVWNTAYAEPDFFSWMLNKNKANIHLYAGVSTICETNGQGVRMAVADGFHAYQWERDGVIISGATSSNYVANTAGTYRARFSRKQNPSGADWNRWSDPVQVTSQNIGKPIITQTGTIVLKGLDNYASAHLRSEDIHARYYWYKNGVLQNLPGTQDDTTRNVKFSAGSCVDGPCSGNGIYSLVVATADNCTSPPSNGKYIFFNNQAPINITAPATFTGSALSDGQVSLSWTDASSNENGFEIWRRRQTGTTTFTAWQMAPITEANATTVIDKGLVPSSTYQYKIRAAGNAGRSNYTPLATSQYLIITTADDAQSPTVPQNVSANATGIGEIKIQWQPSTDNTGIKEYNIYYGSTVVATGSAVTSYTISNLPLNNDFTFTVRAKDLGNNLSAASSSASANTFVNGLYYKHTTGSYSDLDLINWNIVEFQGTVPNFILTPRTQEDYFNFQFDGYLYINTAGTYQFQTYSDDGSRVTIDNVVKVDNDGQHGPTIVTGTTVSLSAGAHLINVKYFDYTGGQTLVVRYKGPDTGNSFISIPDAALRSGNTTSAMTMMATSSGSMENNIKSEPLIAENTDTKAVLMDIYPNPLRPSQAINVMVAGTHDRVNVKLMDLMGNSYYENNFAADEVSLGKEIIPRQQLAQGIYIMVIHQGNKTIKHKVIVKE